jgi:glycosyltransferase involved in cell wall biosynthesis
MIDDWGVDRSRIEVVRSGIDLSRFEQPIDRTRARERLGVPEDAIVVGALTVLRPVKRVEDLVAAAGLAAQEDPRIHVVLMGSIFEDSADTIRGWARAAGLGDRIRVTGRVEDPENVIGALDIYVNCSVFEGISNSIMEAMAAGVAVVATRVGGTPEIAHDGENALLVAPRDVNGLAAAISRLAMDRELRRKLGEEARRRAHERFGVGRMVQEYDALYRRMALERSPTIASRSVRASSGLLTGIALLAGERLRRPA